MAKPKKPARPAHTSPKKATEEKGGRRNSGGGKKEFDNTNRGAMFLNDKEGNDARPDYTGTIHVQVPENAEAGDVVELRIAGWIREPKNGGDDYLSLNVQLPKPKKSKGKKDEDESDD